MGLLGESFDDPRTAATLQLAAGLLGSPRFGSGLAGGLLGYTQSLQQAKGQKQLEELKNLQMQQMQQDVAQKKVQAEQLARQQQWLSNLPAPQSVADPTQRMMLEGVKNNALPLSVYLSSLQKDETPVALGDGGMLVTKSGKVLVENQKKQTPPSGILEYEYAKSQGYPGTFEQWDTARKRAGATNVSVSTDKSFGEAFAKDAAGALATSRDQARAAASTIQSLDRMQKALDAGAIVGPGSTFRTFGLQLGETLGITGKDSAETLANTRKLIQGSAQLNLDGAKALQGQGQVSNFERQMVEKAAGGGVDNMTAPEIRALIGVLRKLNSSRISGHQEMLQKVDPKFKEFTPFYQVDMPQTEQGVRRYNPATGKIE